MTLSRRDGVIVGGVLGALAAMLLTALGLPQVGVISDPLILVVAGTLASAAMAVRRGDIVRWLALLDALGLVACAILAFTRIPVHLAAGWLRNDGSGGPSPEAVIVLSDGLNLDGTLSPGGVDRLLHGIDVLRSSGASDLVTTRIEFDWGGRHASNDADQRRIVLPAVSAEHWIVLPIVHSTRDEAVEAARTLRPRNVRRLAVVTSPLHSRRACAVFERVGFTVTCRPSPDRVHMTAAPAMPSDRLATWRSYLYERLATWKYAWRGWIGDQWRLRAADGIDDR